MRTKIPISAKLMGSLVFGVSNCSYVSYEFLPTKDPLSRAGELQVDLRFTAHTNTAVLSAAPLSGHCMKIDGDLVRPNNFESSDFHHFALDSRFCTLDNLTAHFRMCRLDGPA